MAYKRAIDLLPEDLIKAIQYYIDGEYIYIPRETVTEKSGAILLKQGKTFLYETLSFI